MAELALAVVSLTFQVFAGCIKGYRLLSEARDLPKEYEYVRVRLRTEEFRLLDWARVIQISEDDGTLAIGITGRGILLDVLQQQKKLLFRFAQYDEHLAAITDAIHSGSSAQTSIAEADPSQVRFPESKDLLRRALSYIHATSNLPRRLRWVAHHKGEVDILLSKLTNLNNFLAESLDRSQVGKLLELQVRTNYEIMQLNSTVGQLLSIVQAERSHASPTEGARSTVNHGPILIRDQGDENARDYAQIAMLSLPRENLASLAQAKALNLAIQEGGLTDPLRRNLGLNETVRQITSVELDEKDFIFLDNIPESGLELEEPRTEAIFCPLNAPRSKGRHVWVEWKQIPRCNKSYHQGKRNKLSVSNKDDKMNGRLAALVAMLHSVKSTELFRAARCLGYFYMNTPIATASSSMRIGSTAGHDNDNFEPRCGLVFEKPPGCDRPISLLELLQAQKHHQHEANCNIPPLPPTPSLTKRAALALSVAGNIERLHAVNWLHKGLRSYNILFFAGEEHATSGIQGQQSHTRKLQASSLNCGCVDLGRPILSGFDYSRPTGEQQWTEKAAQRNPAHDIYRHPEVQQDYQSGNNKTAFKKSYDYYSLGLVLLEIAYWQPLDHILGVDLEMALLKNTIKARKQLLYEAPHLLNDVRGRMGNVMHSAIQACLQGPTAFGLDEADDEADAAVAVRLQREFYSKVVEKLKTICI